MTAAPSKLKGWLNTGLAMFYPEVCQLCKDEPATSREGYVGRQCWSQVRFIRPPFCERCGLPYQGDITTLFVCTNCHESKLYFTSARSAVVAKTVVLEVIHLFKYSRALWFENFLAHAHPRSGARAAGRRLGFHCARAVASAQGARTGVQPVGAAGPASLGRAVNIRCAEKILRRDTPTATQTHLNRDQRAANMKNAFAVRPGAEPQLAGRRIVLVDDVFTTGATTNDCARALRDAGAAEVCVWTVARGL